VASDKGEVVVSLNGHHTTGGHATVDFEVRDTGIGIESKDLDSLFQPFVQLPTSTGQPRRGNRSGVVH
jgi:signal transduction histidine kinase